MKLLFALSLFIYSNAIAQSSHELNSSNFIVIRNQEEIGTLHVSRINEGINTTYALTSSVHVKALVNIHIHETIINEFSKEILTTSLHQRKFNDFNSSDKVVVKSGDNYMCETEILNYLGNRITSTVLMLYFHEPIHLDKVYSESFAEMIAVKRLGLNAYSLKLPNQSTTDYYYKDGVLTKVDAHTRWGLITFQRETPLASR